MSFSMSTPCASFISLQFCVSATFFFECCPCNCIPWQCSYSQAPLHQAWSSLKCLHPLSRVILMLPGVMWLQVFLVHESLWVPLCPLSEVPSSLRCFHTPYCNHCLTYVSRTPLIAVQAFFYSLSLIANKNIFPPNHLPHTI